jgi:putative glutamine amidotransferase
MIPSYAKQDNPPNIGLIYSKAQITELQKGKDELILYKELILKNKGKIVVLSPMDSEEILNKQLSSINGLLIPDSPTDIDPVFYKQDKVTFLGPVDKEFDEFEFRILKFASDNKLPVIGIGRGALIINVYFGGTLYQDIPSQVNAGKRVSHRGRGENEDSRYCDHMVMLSPDSYIFDVMLQSRRIRVNSNHHQSIRRIAPGFDVTARADDYVVEAIKHNGKVFILGLQFHPERMINDDPRCNKFFQKLVREAGK